MDEFLSFSDMADVGLSCPLVISFSEENLQKIFKEMEEQWCTNPPTPNLNPSVLSEGILQSSVLGQAESVVQSTASLGGGGGGGAVNPIILPVTLSKEGEDGDGDGDDEVVEIPPLQHKLDMEFATYRQYQGLSINSLNSSSFMNDGHQALYVLQSTNPASIRGYDPMMKDKSDGGANSIPNFVTQNLGIQVEPPTSELSGKQSYVEIEGKMEPMENTDPAEAKRIRRKIINRNSARRSRKRKHDQMADLQKEVLQLQLENSALLKQCNVAVADAKTLRTKVSQLQSDFSSLLKKYNVATADAETLGVKMKMADDLMESVDEALRLIHRTNILQLLTTFLSVSENPCNAADTPMQEDPVPSVEVHHGSVVGEEMERNTSMHSKDQDLWRCILEGLSDYESILE